MWLLTLSGLGFMTFISLKLWKGDKIWQVLCLEKSLSQFNSSHLWAAPQNYFSKFEGVQLPISHSSKHKRSKSLQVYLADFLAVHWWREGFKKKCNNVTFQHCNPSNKIRGSVQKIRKPINVMQNVFVWCLRIEPCPVASVWWVKRTKMNPNIYYRWAPHVGHFSKIRTFCSILVVLEEEYR